VVPDVAFIFRNVQSYWTAQDMHYDHLQCQ